MNIDELRMLGRDCYSAFNQNPPDHSARAWALWTEMCAEIPVTASPFIREKILELDGMPRNFGKAVRLYGQEWSYSRSTGRAVHERCPDCDKEIPGYFWTWRKTREGVVRSIVQCQCNRGKVAGEMPHMTKNQAVSAGLEVIPQGANIGSLVYELQLQGQSVSLEPNAYVKAAKNRNFKRRQTHLDALANAEGWQ